MAVDVEGLRSRVAELEQRLAQAQVSAGIAEVIIRPIARVVFVRIRPRVQVSAGELSSLPTSI